MIKKCPVCSSGNINRVDNSLSIFRCNDCTHEFAVIRKEQQEKYEEGYYNVKTKNWFSHPNYKLFDFILSQISKNNDASLLDIGCGNGDFLKYARSKNKDIRLAGIDLVNNIGRGIEFIQGDIYKTQVKGKYDIVVSLGTIEHLDNLKGFISITKGLLKENGIAIMMTIDSGSMIYNLSKMLKKLKMRGSYEQLYEYKHLHHFTRKSLRKLFEINNFKVVRQITHNYPLNAIDIHNKPFLLSIIYKASAMGIFLVSSLIKKEMLQTVVCKKCR